MAEQQQPYQAQFRNGGDFEEFVVGRRHSSERVASTEIKGFEQCYALAKEQQGEDWDPKNPHTFAAQLLLSAVAQEIKSITHEPAPDVRMFRLVGSIMDNIHRFDLSIEYISAEKSYRIFIDLTIRPHKHVVNGYYFRPRDFEPKKLKEFAERIAIDLLQKHKASVLSEAAWLDIDSGDHAH